MLAVLLLVCLQEDEIDFKRDIRPILSDTCFQCHGPDPKANKSGLRLDSKNGALAAITPGKPAESKLWERITSSDKDEVMPPPPPPQKTTPRPNPPPPQ